MRVDSPNDANIIGWQSYHSVKEEISDRILDSIEDAVGESSADSLELLLTFSKPFTLVKYKGKDFLDIKNNRPIAFEIIED